MILKKSGLLFILLNVLVLMIPLSYNLSAQQVMTEIDAIKLAIDHNYSVQLAEQNIRISENNATKENNGYKPTVNAVVGPNATLGGSTQSFVNGTETSTGTAISWAAGGSLNANYTLLDKSRDIRLDQMKERILLSNLQLRQSIENTIIQVYNQYYVIAQLSENKKAVQEALTLSRKRKERVQLRYELSQGLKLDILNAQVDISRDSVNFLNVSQQLTNAKRDLEVIIGTEISNEYMINSNITYRPDMDKETLLDKAIADNVNIILSDQLQQINQLDIDIIEKINHPTIGANASLNYNYQNNASGAFIQNATNAGLNVGLTLNWNLFDGGQKKILEQNAKINIESEALTRDQIIIELKRDIDNAWGNYKNALYILGVEENSIEINRLNLERTADLFDAGQVSSVDFRQAQLNLLQSETGYNQARYQAKLLELELLYLSGSIIDTLN